MGTDYVTITQPFQLSSGEWLPQMTVALDTYGNSKNKYDRAVLICHALTASSKAGDTSGNNDQKEGFWAPLIGSGRTFDTDNYYIVCMNVLGSCYGTTGPTSINPETGEPYGPEFPQVSVRDMVRIQKIVMDKLDIPGWYAVCGGSMGGQQVLDWTHLYPNHVQKAVVIAATFNLSDYAIAFNWMGIKAILDDENYCEGYYYKYDTKPSKGLSLARIAGMLTYKSDPLFQGRFGREEISQPELSQDKYLDYQVENYLEYQGNKFVDRFDANSYLTLIKAMNDYDISAAYDYHRISALRRITAEVLLIGIDSDLLYPPHKLQEMAREFAQSGISVQYKELQSDQGHDAFLVEFDQLSQLIAPFLDKTQLKVNLS